MCRHGELVWMPELGPYGRYIDKCMKSVIKEINNYGYTTLACCCGHGKYPRTVVVKDPSNNVAMEFFTGKYLVRHGEKGGDGRSKIRNFYKMDKEGFYYLPESIYMEL